MLVQSSRDDGCASVPGVAFRLEDAELQGLLELIPGAALLRRDSDGRPLAANAPYARWFGGSSGAPVDWRPRVVTTRTGDDGEAVCVLDDVGAPRWLSPRTRAASWAAEGERCTLELLDAIGHDVGPSRGSALSPRGDAARFAFVMKHLPDYPWLYDLRAQRYDFVGDGFRRLWGRPPPLEGIWEHLTSWMHADDVAGATEGLRRVLRREVDELDLEFRVIHPDGSVHWIYTRTVTICDPDGEPAQLVGVTVDVTERKLTAERLRESEERLGRMSEAMRDGFLLVDAEGTRILHANDAVSALTGVSRERLLADSRSLFEAIHPDDRGRVVDAVGGQLSGRNDAPECLEIRVFRADGSTRWLESCTWPALDEGGARRQVVGTLRDIDARRSAESALRDRTEQLQRSLREKEILLAEVHHRVKNNLQAIVGLVHMMAAQAERRPLGETVRELEQRILALALVHETLYRSADLSSVDMQSYLERLGQMLLDGAASAELETSLEVRADPGVTLDLEQAVRVGLITNELVSNALKHAFAGRARGTIALDLRRTAEGGFVLRVSDDGVGIPPALDFGSESTLGLRLVSGLARQSRGVARRAAGDANAVEVVCASPAR